jgi:MazG family protein
MSAAAAEAFQRLVEIMAALRGPEGCPWDREQTIDSLGPFVLEEAYEVVEAIDAHNHQGLCEELGDFVFEAVFLAQLEAEAGHFTIVDSLKSIADKLVRRHPHVFARADGEAPLESAGQVRTRWDEIRAKERGGQKLRTLLNGIPSALPSLLRAHHIGVRCSSVGFDWPTTSDVLAKIQEEVDELREVIETRRDSTAASHGGGSDESAKPDAGSDRIEEEMGDLLFSIANLSRKLGIEPEKALRKANDKFTRRFEKVEQAVSASGRTLGQVPLDELEQEWETAKRNC